MSYKMPGTVAETIGQVHRGELVLPAIQREYVWEPQQVLALFDSLMRGYPIGGFLSWRVSPQTAEKFRFYGFLKDYNEFNNRHSPALDVPPSRDVNAILDGQQRLTSLNIGLRGTYAYRTSGAWRTKASSYPARRLYLNVLAEAGENEAGLRYDFRLMTDQQVQGSTSDQTLWFPVANVYETAELTGIWKQAQKFGVANDETAVNMLTRLWEAVHNSQMLHFYEETDQDVERVLDIFIRVNSAGTTLSYSDLLLSIATAQWDERDARDEIHTLVDTLHGVGQGFNFSQDVVLKSGLVLAGIGDFAFKVRNFTAANMATLQDRWDAISGSLELATNVLADFGLSDATLTADSVLIPVAYYVHRRNLADNYRSEPKSQSDRELLRSWVLRSLVMPGVWGSGLDTMLRDIRDVIDADGADGFPLSEIEARMTVRGKSLLFEDQQIDDLLNLQYGRKRTFATLALLFPHVDTRNVHHVDHVFPRALLNKSALRRAGFTEQEIGELQAMRDQLPNLQLLEGPVNTSKSAKDPRAWAAALYSEEWRHKAYLTRNCLPDTLPASVSEFRRFFELRRSLLAEHMLSVLGAGDGGVASAVGVNA